MRGEKVRVDSGGDGRSSCSQAKTAARRALYGASPHADPAARARSESCAAKSPIYVIRPTSACFVPRRSLPPYSTAMSEELPPAAMGKASAAAAEKTKAPAAPPAAMGSRGSAAAFKGFGCRSPAASPLAMGSRGPSGIGSAAAFLGRGSTSPAAPNPSHSAASFFPAGAVGRGSSSNGWGYPRTGGSSNGGGPFTSSPSSCGFPFPPPSCPVWCEAPGVGSPSNWDPARERLP